MGEGEWGKEEGRGGRGRGREEEQEWGGEGARGRMGKGEGGGGRKGEGGEEKGRKGEGGRGIQMTYRSHFQVYKRTNRPGACQFECR